MILTIVPMNVFTIAKIAATMSSVSTYCRVSPGGKAVTVTVRAGMSVQTQMANALMTTRMRKRMAAILARARDGSRHGGS